MTGLSWWLIRTARKHAPPSASAARRSIVNGTRLSDAEGLRVKPPCRRTRTRAHLRPIPVRAGHRRCEQRSTSPITTRPSKKLNAWGARQSWRAYSGEPGGDSNGWWDPSNLVVSGGYLHFNGRYDASAGRYSIAGVSFGGNDQTYGMYLVRMKGQLRPRSGDLGHRAPVAGGQCLAS